MKVGTLQFFSWPDRRIPLPEVYERAFDRIELMDRSGYDAVWLAEHHFSSFSICPSVHVMAAHVAARTSNLRIGTGVSLAPFYNPLRLAEEIALLDVLTNGRINWGVGRGYQRGEFEAFGIDPEKSYDVFREHVEVVVGAWTTERLSYRGEHFECNDVEVLPKPHQQPHPPMWLAASSAEALKWAGENGFSVMLDPHSPDDRIGQKLAFYRTQLESGGHAIEGRDLPVARLLAIHEDHDEAERIARAGAQWTVSSHRKPGVAPAAVTSAVNEEHSKLTLPGFDGEAVQRYLDEVIVWGTPDEVLERLGRLESDIGVNYLLCSPLSHDTFETFTEKVLPRLL